MFVNFSFWVRISLCLAHLLTQKGTGKRAKSCWEMLWYVWNLRIFSILGVREEHVFPFNLDYRNPIVKGKHNWFSLWTLLSPSQKRTVFMYLLVSHSWRLSRNTVHELYPAPTLFTFLRHSAVTLHCFHILMKMYRKENWFLLIFCPVFLWTHCLHFSSSR